MESSPAKPHISADSPSITPLVPTTTPNLNDGVAHDEQLVPGAASGTASLSAASAGHGAAAAGGGGSGAPTRIAVPITIQPGDVSSAFSASVSSGSPHIMAQSAPELVTGPTPMGNPQNMTESALLFSSFLSFF